MDRPPDLTPPSENWLYRRLRLATEEVESWTPERRAQINYRPLTAEEEQT